MEDDELEELCPECDEEAELTVECPRGHWMCEACWERIIDDTVDWVKRMQRAQENHGNSQSKRR